MLLPPLREKGDVREQVDIRRRIETKLIIAILDFDLT